MAGGFSMSEQQDDHTHYQLSPDAAERLEELSQDVRGRLREIAQIVGPLVGVQATENSLIMFAPRDAGSAAESGDHMEVVVIDGHEVCYGTIGGESFAESPCMHPPIRV
jgi:hypothetical protein